MQQAQEWDGLASVVGSVATPHAPLLPRMGPSLASSLKEWGLTKCP